MKTEEGNKLIAEFMGHEAAPEGMVNIYMDGEEMKEFGQEYHSSWDWLMPVVEKIDGLGFTVTMQPYQCHIFDKSKNYRYPENLIIEADFKDTRLENTWEGVIAFIQWYNKNINNGK